MRNGLQRGLLLLGLALAGAGAILLSSPPAAHAQALSKRLVLKDGSYQPVTRWEVKGDRVRYMSADRFVWEEIPNSLIDWDATNKYNAELTNPETKKNPDIKLADAEEKAERDREEAASPTVAPGIRLPAQGGVFMIDTFQGKPQLVELVQSGGEVNQQRGRNILRAAINPLALTQKQTIELKGAHAAAQAHEPDPEFYVNVDPAGPATTAGGAQGKPADLDLQPDRYRVVRVESKKSSRVVGKLNVALTGHIKQEQTVIPATATAMPGGWVKVVSSQPLMPGEYALVEMLNPKEMNLYVWDFGVNPSAPQNSSTWKPAQTPPAKTGTNESPILTGRPPKP
jgi:hypothetical protein